MNEHDEPFLKRWSRRKAEAKERDPAEAAAEAEQGHASNAGGGEREDAGGTPDGSAGNPGRQLTEADFADVDFEALDMQSDYARFLAPDVPDSIRYKALRKLWFADESFTQIEPFQDYAGDFTDAACAVPAGTLKTAYRIGKGFLSDEEVADWEKLGAPEPEVAAAAPDTAEAAGQEGPGQMTERKQTPTADDAQVAHSAEAEQQAGKSHPTDTAVPARGAAKPVDTGAA